MPRCCGPDRLVPPIVLLLGAITLGAGCDALRPATAPMRTVGLPGGQADRLLVLLPGRGSAAESFAEQGFVKDARAAGVTAQILAVDAHLGYYQRRIIHVRLDEDVIRPARAHGARSVWLAGISLGGIGALITSFRYPGSADGLLLVAPYLGPEGLIREIEAAGGLAAWKPPPQPVEYEALWAWLKGYATSPAERPPLLLAYGENDRFARAERVLAAVLPKDRVFTTAGGHDWRTWRVLWRRAFAHPALQQALAATTAASETPANGPAASASPDTR